MATISAEDKTHRQRVRAWCMYDWANSAFATTIMAAMLPPYFSNVAASTLPKAQASSIWGYATSFSMLLMALLGPILGAIADYRGSKKRFLFAFLTLAILFTGTLFFVGEGDWVMAIVFFVLASVGNAGANIFYDSLLPHVAYPEEIDQVSARGYALGYLGGGLLLLINLIWFMKPEWFGFANASAAVRAAFLSVSVWWVIFAIPLFRRVPEPPRSSELVERHLVRAGIRRVIHTFGEIQHYRELFLFLVAWWLYDDGIGTIMKMATIYGAEIGIGTTDLVGALLLTQIVGVPLTILFGRLTKPWGTKRAIYLGIAVYGLISVAGYFMSQPWHFWALAGAVGTVQGGTQALSRSLFGAMVPKKRSAEFFGFFDISSKFAGIMGPLLFGLTAGFLGSSRYAIVSLIVFFIGGAFVLARVNERQGIALAQAETARAEA